MYTVLYVLCMYISSIFMYMYICGYSSHLAVIQFLTACIIKKKMQASYIPNKTSL